MAEHGHQRLQRHPGVDQCGGVGMPKLVWGNGFQSCIGGGADQFGAQDVHRDAASLVGEQELDRLAGARVRQRLARRAVRDDPVDELQSLIVDGHHPLGIELAQRNLQPGPGAGHLMHAIKFQVEQLADAHPGGAQQQQRVGAQPVRRGVQRGREPPVGVGGQVPGQRPGQSRDIAREHQLAAGRLDPAPFVDVIDQPPDGQDPRAPLGGRQGRAGARVARGGHGGQIRLDVALPAQAGQRGQRGVVCGEEPREVPEAAGDTEHGRPGAGARRTFQVGHQRIGHSCWDTGEVPSPRPTQVRGVLRSRGDLPTQVIQNSAGGIQRGAVVLELPLMRLLAHGDRGGELGDIGVVELAQRAAGLDQHPHRDLAGQPGRDLGRVA